MWLAFGRSIPGPSTLTDMAVSRAEGRASNRAWRCTCDRAVQHGIGGRLVADNKYFERPPRLDPKRILSCPPTYLSLNRSELPCWPDSIGQQQPCIESGISTSSPACRLLPPPPSNLARLPACLLAAFADLLSSGTIGGALFGFDVSSMSAWIGSKQYLEYFGHPNSDTQGGITASMSAGSFIGSLAAGWLCDHMGRRGILQVASVIWVIGAALQCSAQNIAHLIVGRIISGLASKFLPVSNVIASSQFTDACQLASPRPKFVSTSPSSPLPTSVVALSASNSGPSTGASLSCTWSPMAVPYPSMGLHPSV